MNDAPPLVLDVVAFGIINAGKSSLINALAGRPERAVGPIGGTTAAVEGVDWPWAEALAPDLGGDRVRLVDTPGIDEAEPAGIARGELALGAAATADLILFVLAEDLTAVAHAALLALHAAGKPMVVVLNKVDLLDDGGAVLGAVRAALGGIIPPENVVAAAAAPIARRPVRDEAGRVVRVETVRGTAEIDDLRSRLVAILGTAAADLRALGDAAAAVDRHVAGREAERGRLRARAEAVADQTAAALAVAMGLNPIPVLGFLGGPGGLVVLVRRVADVYGVPLTAAMARGLAGDLIRGGRAKLWGSLATTVAGGFLKIIPGVGTVAGAVSQGAGAGYFGHVVGRALVTYLENGQDWGDGGLVAELDRVAARADRRAITRGLVEQIRAKLGRPAGEAR